MLICVSMLIRVGNGKVFIINIVENVYRVVLKISFAIFCGYF